MTRTKDGKDGFAVYLNKNQDKIPKTLSFFHAPVNLKFMQLDHLKLLNELHDNDDFNQFRSDFMCKNALSILIYISKLSGAAALWQRAFDAFSDQSLAVVSLTTGASASAGLALINSSLELLLLKKPLRGVLATLLSLLPTVLIVDGLWQPIWLLTDHAFIHSLLYFLVSSLFLLLQDQTSQLIDHYLPHYKKSTFKPPLAIIPLLTIAYVAFGYLPRLLPQSLSSTNAAGLAVLIATAAWGLVDYLTTACSLRFLNNEYKLYLTSPDRSSDAAEQNFLDEISEEPEFDDYQQPIPKQTVCQKITDFIYSIFSSYKISGLRIAPKHSHHSHLSQLEFSHIKSEPPDEVDVENRSVSSLESIK